MDKVLFSSRKDDWETPRELFDALNQEFQFTLDVASSHNNALCRKHYTKEENGLAQSWAGETVWCNPPYGREAQAWIAKASEEAGNGVTTVMLLPARTDTIAFHRYIYHKAEVRFLKGRLHFRMGGEGPADRAPFPSMIVIFRPKKD